MKSLQELFTFVDTLEDGNCSFNAFGIVLISIFPELITGLKTDNTPDNKYQDFIQKVALAWNVPATFESITKALTNEPDVDVLQQRLAPILRQIAIQQLKNADNEVLLGALIDSCHKFIDGDLDSDDVFKRHPFIQEQFAKLKADNVKAENNRQVMEQALINWWREKGLQQFIQEMEKGGAWAGDLELALLAQYFGLNLDIIKDGQVYHSHVSNGQLPASFVATHPNIISDLITRNVINPVNHCFTCTTKQELATRLDKVPNYEEVIKAYENKTTDFIFPPACVREMNARQMIKIINKEVFTFNNAQSILQATEVAKKAEIVSFFQQKPTIAVEHSGKHYRAAIAKVATLASSLKASVKETSTPKPATSVVASTSAPATSSLPKKPKETATIISAPPTSPIIKAVPPVIPVPKPPIVIEHAKPVLSSSTSVKASAPVEKTDKKSISKTEVTSKATTLKEATLTALSAKTIQYNPTQQENLLQQAKREHAEVTALAERDVLKFESKEGCYLIHLATHKEFILYTINDTEKYFVSIATQIKLDESLATRKQENEFTLFSKKKDIEAKDAKLAKKMSKL